MNIKPFASIRSLSYHFSMAWPAGAVRTAAMALLLVTTSAWATGDAPLPTPANALKASRAVFDLCIQAQDCDRNACASNGGLSYCYYEAQLHWDKNLHAAERSLREQGGWCARHWRSLAKEHAAFRRRAMAAKSLADGPYGSDHDLGLLLAQQQYELAYHLLSNSACNKIASVPRNSTMSSRR
ncbi:hypothetical protein GJV26_25935 [Massilia dura]|uniref:DUF1311 domain-containing protein n=1 Tax=Pseudoduganella dura TaxID=321982 RepID=A0A6I3XN56_9BURK|nr:hypothetical protein [Pseudoduganella dura]MUI15873.1 hypothetical protein [Pseudoduganella dura]